MIIKNFQYEKQNDTLYIYANDFKYSVAEIFEGEPTDSFVDEILTDMGLIKNNYFTCEKEEDIFNNIIQKNI